MVTISKIHPANPSKPSTSNSFAALANVGDPDSKGPSLPEKEINNDKQKVMRDPSLLPEDLLFDKAISLTQSITPVGTFQGMEVENTPFDPSSAVEANKELQEY